MSITVGQFKQMVRSMVGKAVSTKAIEFAGKGEREIPNKFPTVEQTLIKLMTEQYPVFVEDIWWVAPRPTTFRVLLKNGESFFLLKNQSDWTVQVRGKKYQLPSIDAEQRAAESISDMLKYGEPPKEEKAKKAKPKKTEPEMEPPLEDLPPIEAPEKTPPTEA